MRATCLDCTRKHIGQASILVEESATGDYPEHFWLAMGHMAEAESECMKDFPELAAYIRQERIEMIENDDYYTDFVELIRLANAAAEIILEQEETNGDVIEQESDRGIYQAEDTNDPPKLEGNESQ